MLLDNGRSGMLGTEFQDMLRCIRCAACMNHCPVYAAIGGHAYGWVYPGPMGSVLDPGLIGVERSRPPAQRLDLLRPLRKRLPGAHPPAQPDAPLARTRVRAPSRPRRRPPQPRPLGVVRAPPRRLSLSPPAAAIGLLGLLGRRKGRFTSLPLAGNWTAGRDLPAPEGDTFFARYARQQRGAS